MGAPPSYLGDAEAVIELARYQEGPASVVVSRDGDELLFWSSYDDDRTITKESRIVVADFVAKGEGPWPWYDLGRKRDGNLMVLDALGVDRPAWTTPLPDDVLDLFSQARSGSTEVIELLAWGAEPDPVDPCGASPLWYGVRSLSAGIVVALIDAGADAGRRIELSAQGEKFTTILHEIVRLGRTVGLAHALANGTPGPYQTQAAIAALHSGAATAADTDWLQIAALYRVLAMFTPTPIVELNALVAHGLATNLESALAGINRLESANALPNYYLLPASKADILRRLGRPSEAATAYRTALALVTNPAERRYLERRLASCE